MDWTPISDCCKVVNGSTPSRKKAEFWGGQIDWFTPKDLSKLSDKYVSESPEKITEAGYKSCSTTMIPAGSLLFTSRAPIGHIAINRKDVCTNQGFKNLVPNGNVDVLYLYYAIKYFTPHLKELGNGATFKELSKKSVESFRIPLPPLETQKKIAEILDTADAYRQKTKELIAKYDELAQSLFLDMFGDPVTNPKGWETQPLGEITDVRDGTHDSPKYIEKGYPLITSKNIKDGSISMEKVNYISKEDYDSINARSKVDIGDILMPMIGTIGNPVRVSEAPYFAIKNVALIKNSAEESIKNEIVLALLKGHYLKWYSSNHNRGGTQKFLSLGSIRKMPIIVPPTNLQNQFVERLEDVNMQRKYAKQVDIKSNTLFNSLLQKAFKGELV